MQTEAGDPLGGVATESVIVEVRTWNKNNDQQNHNPSGTYDQENISAAMDSARVETFLALAEYDGRDPIRRPNIITTRFHYDKSNCIREILYTLSIRN